MSVSHLATGATSEIARGGVIARLRKIASSISASIVSCVLVRPDDSRRFAFDPADHVFARQDLAADLPEHPS
jgi:hypothetical protein